MKPTPNSSSRRAERVAPIALNPPPSSGPNTPDALRAGRSRCTILAFGAHPDDIEFGCGGIIAGSTRGGATIRFVVCSRGEASTHGTVAQRAREAKTAARLLGAQFEFLPLEGDAQMEYRPANARKLAAAIRKYRPRIVLAPTLAGNQHPDHCCLAKLVRDAARLARFGGLKPLRSLPIHRIEQLLFYAITSDGETTDAPSILIDISDPRDLAAWKAAMAAHATQGLTHPYAELQLARARVLGLRAGVEYAQALYPNDPLVFPSLAALGASARRY
jgi:LmbE family N-acetylglucosaminyl deacetylase